MGQLIMAKFRGVGRIVGEEAYQVAARVKRLRLKESSTIFVD